MNTRQGCGFFRKTLIKARRHVVRDHLPRWTLGEIFHRTEHVVEHAVSLHAKITPIHGIERCRCRHCLKTGLFACQAIFTHIGSLSNSFENLPT